MKNFNTINLFNFLIKKEILTHEQENHALKLYLTYDGVKPKVLCEVYKKESELDYKHDFRNDFSIDILDISKPFFQKLTKEEYFKHYPENENTLKQYETIKSKHDYCVSRTTPEFPLKYFQTFDTKVVTAFNQNFDSFINEVKQQPLLFNVHKDSTTSFISLISNQVFGDLLKQMDKNNSYNQTDLVVMVSKIFFSYIDERSKPDELFKLDINIAKEMINKFLSLEKSPLYHPTTTIQRFVSDLMKNDIEKLFDTDIQSSAELKTQKKQIESKYENLLQLVEQNTETIKQLGSSLETQAFSARKTKPTTLSCVINNSSHVLNFPTYVVVNEKVVIESISPIKPGEVKFIARQPLPEYKEISDDIKENKITTNAWLITPSKVNEIYGIKKSIPQEIDKTDQETILSLKSQEKKKIALKLFVPANKVSLQSNEEGEMPYVCVDWQGNLNLYKATKDSFVALNNDGTVSAPISKNDFKNNYEKVPNSKIIEKTR